MGPKAVRDFWKRDKSLMPAGIRTQYRPAPITLKIPYAKTATRYCLIYTATQNKPGSERPLLLYETVCEIMVPMVLNTRRVAASDATK